MRRPYGWQKLFLFLTLNKEEKFWRFTMNVSKIMNQNVQSCKLGDSLETAAAIMWEHDLGCLPVMNSSEEIVGMITDPDICMACYTQGQAPHSIRVSSAMSQAVFSCAPDDSVQQAAETMGSHQVRR